MKEKSGEKREEIQEKSEELHEKKEENYEEKIKERKEKIANWLKNPYTLAILGILIFGFALRLYFFFLTNGQTLWHDEAEYAAMAKHFLSLVKYPLNPQRIFLFSGVIAGFFLLGLSEQFVKFALVLLPSTTLIFLVYLLGKEMFNKKIALIASLLTAVSWTFLFWTARLQPDFLSMCFQVAAVLFMWKYWKQRKTKLIILSAVLASLGFLFKVSGMLVPVIFFIFILLKERLSFLKNKQYWIFLAVFLLCLIPQFVYSYFAFSNPIAIFGTTYVTTVTDTRPFGWYNLNFYYMLTENILFILFLIGFILALSFLLYIDTLIKNKNKWFNPDIFSVLVLVLMSAYYIFYIKGTDDRWVFLWLPFIFFFIGKSSLFIYNHAEKYNKLIAFIIIALLLGYGTYSQVTHANQIIQIKLDSYSPVREAAFWIKANSNKNDVVVTASLPQTVYYGEREVIVYSVPFINESDFNVFINENKPKFLVTSVFEFHPAWVYRWVEQNKERLKPLQAYFSDPQQTSPILIVYEVKYN